MIRKHVKQFMADDALIKRALIIFVGALWRILLSKKKKDKKTKIKKNKEENERDEKWLNEEKAGKCV